MKFFMISDLHLGKGVEVRKAKEQLVNLCSRIRADSYPQETILFVIMGDVINASETSAFVDAKICLDCLREELTGYTVKFEFVPGNHDLPAGDISPFDRFIAEYNPSCSFGKAGAYSVVYDGINFIFADSNITRDYRLPGKLDLESIRREVKPMMNLLFCHHGFEQSYGGDHDTISNANEVLNTLGNMGIQFVFHGHTHRADSSIAKNGIIEIGCGTLFKNVTDMDGIQNQFSVGYIRNEQVIRVDRFVVSKDGSNVYPSETIYPKQQIFLDPRTIGKKLYNPVQNYIKRKVLSHTVAIMGEVERFLSNEKEISLKEALNKSQKVLFLSDAGQGKSIEMENLAYELSEEFYFPFLFRLRDYTGVKIEELLPEQYNKLSTCVRILLFDGYDELSSDYKVLFESQLKLYLDDNPDTNIVISSRSNFCKIEKESESKTFPGFKVYDLCKLSKKSREEYIVEQGIDVKHLVDEARRVKVDKLLENPFYLTRICDLFKKNGSLPPKAELMDKLVEASFSVDDEKFVGNLEESYEDLMKSLRNVAFAMQLMQQSKLYDFTEYQKLFKKDERELISHSGLFVKEVDTWRFIHNNFREYLAARYLSELSQEEVLSYISNGEGINPSWINTLGFLTGIPLPWDLNNWIAQNAPTALVKFEPDKIEEDTRFEVFYAIFSYYEERHLWFRDELCDEEQLAHFAESPTVLTFLLDRISNPVHVVSQYTAISILRFFKNLYGKGKEVLTCLLGCCEKYPETRADVCRLAIFAIHQLELGDKAVTEHLMSLFSNSDNDYIRLGMYEYFLAVNEHNEYVNYFLEGTKYITYKVNDDSNRIGNESFELTNGLKAMSTADSISSAINYFVSKEADFYGVNEIYDVLMEKAITLYIEGEQQLYEVILQSCIKNLQGYDSKKIRNAVIFFEKTNTLKDAICIIADFFMDEVHYMADIMYLHPELTEVLCIAYTEERFNNHNAFENIVARYVNDAMLYNKCAEMILERTGIQLPEFVPRIDYEEVRQNGWKKYFDALFSKEVAEDMLSELLNEIGKPDLMIKDLLDQSLDISWESALRHLQVGIYHSGNPELLVKDFFDVVPFDRFTVMECKKILIDQKDIEINPEQKKHLMGMIIQYLNKELLIKEVRQESESTVVSLYVMALIQLTLYLDVELSEDVLLELTMVPASYLGDSKLELKYSYLLKYVSIEKLRKRIAQNISASPIGKMLLEDHIDFCAENRFDDATNVSLILCQTADVDSWVQWHAFEYLYNLHGASYVKEYILPYATGDFLLRIAQECKDISPKDLRVILETEYAKAPSNELMAQLIALESEMGIGKYVELVVKDHRIPEKQNYSHTATSMIKFIGNPKYLPLLEQLLDVVLLPDFVDDSFWGLRGSLSEAMVNCSKVDANATISILNARLAAGKLEEWNILYCNNIIEQIKANQRRYSDQPKTIKEVKTLMGLS